jgi:hypothetical protein
MKGGARARACVCVRGTTRCTGKRLVGWGVSGGGELLRGGGHPGMEDGSILGRGGR